MVPCKSTAEVSFEYSQQRISSTDSKTDSKRIKTNKETRENVNDYKVISNFKTHCCQNCYGNKSREQ